MIYLRESVIHVDISLDRHWIMDLPLAVWYFVDNKGSWTHEICATPETTRNMTLRTMPKVLSPPVSVQRYHKSR